MQTDKNAQKEDEVTSDNNVLRPLSFFTLVEGVKNLEADGVSTLNHGIIKLLGRIL